MTLRIVPGPRLEYFADDALTGLARSRYTIDTRSDRMGFRLRGPGIVHEGSERFVIDGTAMGALQVPADGEPILFMADRQTTGGNPKIAGVISADLHLAAPLAPGERVTFKTCTRGEVQALNEQRVRVDTALPPFQEFSPDQRRSF